MTGIMKKFKLFIKKFFLINDTPHKIAAGAAIGIFMGIVPGEGVISALVVATIFRFNRLSAISSILFTNMWTTFLALPFAAATGAFIFRTNAQDLTNNFNTTYQLGWTYFFSKVIFFELVLPLIIGYLVVASAIALVFYFLIYFLLKYKKVSFK
jgi:uncharacterized protein (DUF2062 family)